MIDIQVTFTHNVNDRYVFFIQSDTSVINFIKREVD